MKLRGRKVLVCGCEATMPPDGKALAKGVRRRRERGYAPVIEAYV